MGLTRKQRDRLATPNQADRCFGVCPAFTTGQALWRGPREKGTGTVRSPWLAISSVRERGASPVSRSRFQFEYLTFAESDSERLPWTRSTHSPRLTKSSPSAAPKRAMKSLVTVAVAL